MWKKYFQILTHEKAQSISDIYIYEGKSVSDVNTTLRTDNILCRCFLKKEELI